MPLSTQAHNDMLTRLGQLGLYVALSKGTTLSAQATAGATSASVNRAVKVGDYLSFNNGTTREVRQVTSVTGSAVPYTANFTAALTATYAANSDVGHAPKMGADFVEPSGTSNPAYARQSATWAASANEAMAFSNTPNFNVPGGNTIGGFGLFSAVTVGTFYGSFLANNIEGFGAAGTYQITTAQVNLRS